MHENIGSVIAANESIAFGVIKPLHFPFVLSHRRLPSLRRNRRPLQRKIQFPWRSICTDVAACSKVDERLLHVIQQVVRFQRTMR
jgi:hypothetical protein